MQIAPVKVLVTAVLTVSMVGFAACGDDGDGGGGGISVEDFPAETSAPEDAKKGGTLTVVAADDVDYIDPGAAYYQFTYMVTDATQRKLLAWDPDDVEKPTPDLAEGEPEISSDGKTITFTIKDGVRFSPPVNREVTSQDFKYAIERAMLPGVPNAYVGAYLSSIEGFAAAEKAVEQNDTVAPDISGIQTPDDKTLVIKLTRPESTGVVQSLTLPAGAPVPEDYAREFDAQTPSTYGEHQVATGPYMIENDESGELTGYTPGKEITLIRNPNWDQATDFRPAYVDRIEIREGFTDTQSATRRILTGDGQVTGDIIPEGPALKEAATKYPDQLALVSGQGNRYVALNTQLPPFDDINVRKAVLAGFDREALRQVRGGELVGTVGTHFLPPTFPGFEEAGGEGTDLDFLADPNGDPQLAAEYFRKAGNQSGKYEGNEPILMVGENSGIDKKQAEVAADEFEKLGFNVELRQVGSNTMYTRFCGRPAAEVHVCPNVGFIKDFNDPQAMLDVPFNGENILPLNNSNWPQLDVPAINKAIEEARQISDPQERLEAWGQIDKDITAQAPAVPFIWDNQADVRSADVNGVVNLFNAIWDLSYTSLKNP